MSAGTPRRWLLLALLAALGHAGALLAAEGAADRIEADPDAPAFFAVASAARFSAVARAGAQPPELGRAGTLGRDDDDERRPDSPFRFMVFGRPLSVTGEYEARCRACHVVRPANEAQLTLGNPADASPAFSNSATGSRTAAPR